MFFLKKLVSAFLMPMPFGLGILFLALWFLWRGRIRVGTILVGLGTVFLAVVSMSALMSGRLGSLEQSTVQLQELPRVDFIVVLGGGHSPRKDLPVLERLGDSARARLLKGVQLHRQQPDSRLIFSGFAGLGRKGEPSHATLMQQAAVQLGVPPESILTESLPQDTFSEVQLISARVGKGPFLLVTDASHMPRAVALFRTQRAEPVPVPTRYMGGSPTTSLFDYFPSSSGMVQAERYWHETLGTMWSRLRGQIKTPEED